MGTKKNCYPDESFYEEYERTELIKEQARRDAEDIIRRPNHYATWPIEPKTFIMENDLDYATGNVIKYVMRHSMKNGREDLEKAKEYIDWLISHHYED